jgi:agmatine deiminase
VRAAGTVTPATAARGEAALRLVAGCRMPAEWERHEATWLTWPHDEAHWPGKFDRVPGIWARMVRELETGEDVHVLVRDAEVERAAREAMAVGGVRGDRVRLHRVPNDFAWARDHGPICVTDARYGAAGGRRVLIDWEFNGWGDKWPHGSDDAVPRHVAALTGLPCAAGPMVLEGGSIDVNGLGALLTTESCLLHPNRNPALSREEIEETLRTWLGVRKVLWLGDGIAGDDTDGHVDDLSRFVGPRTVLTVVEDDPADENHRPLADNLARLRAMTDQDGAPLEVVTVPLPAPVVHEGMRLPASYANFYVGNEVVLLPVFDDPADAAAVEALRRAFPTRRIAAIPSRDLVWGLGAFHCVTQQLPAGP